MVFSIRRSVGVVAAAGALAGAWGGEVRADAHTDALGSCFVASTTDADRVAFVRWMFMALSKHPEVADLTKITEAQREAGNRSTAALVQRLMLTDCRSQSTAVLQHDGLEAVLAAFELVGESAADGLMSHPAVAAQFEALGGYIDEGAWEKFMRESER
jgi:hypothetical protein